jgi:Protein of unknown function (DUF2783)
MLITEPHLDAPDDFYEALIDAHRELSTAQSHELNAKLVLLLANHVGQLGVLKQALNAARASTLAAAGGTAASRAPTLDTPSPTSRA